MEEKKRDEHMGPQVEARGEDTFFYRCLHFVY